MNASTPLRRLPRISQKAFTQYHAPFRIPNRALHFAGRSGRPQLAPSLFLRDRFTSKRVENQIRRSSAESYERPLTNRPETAEPAKNSEADDIAARKAQEPAYELTFTCRKCLNRSSHRVTKQAYHFGTTLITCPGCKNRHLISDHLKIFSDKGVTIEDILKEKGQFLKKGRLGEDGDIEFYDEENNEIGREMAQHKKEE